MFVGGVGVSTESGIPDFRGEAGLYIKENNYKYKPRKMLSKGFFYTHCADFFAFYKSLYPAFDVKPNIKLEVLCELEKNKNLTIITQNIDGLHEKAGSQNVINLHGPQSKIIACYAAVNMTLLVNPTRTLISNYVNQL